jgi:carboxyl-terminal processing protease
MGLVLGATFIGGFLSREFLISPPAFAAEYSFPILEEVQRLLDVHYLRVQPSATLREYAAIRGLLGSLDDRYTFFIEPPVAQSESDALAGVYGGVGIQVRLNSLGEFVIFRYDNSPASRAGIANNDILLTINGETVSAMPSIDSINQSLRGEVKSGNGIDIEYRNASELSVTKVFLVFEVIEVPSVTWSVLPENSDIGYIQISLFTNRTPDEFQTSLTELTDQGVRYLILDLRNNSGGLLQESVEIASVFLDNTTIVYERTQTFERAIKSVVAPVSTTLPLVVLINNNTASAAELVAVALQENGRATLIGQATYGKGSIQQIFRLQDGASLHVTTAEWLSPNKRQLESVGVTPDLSVQTENTSIDNALQAAIELLTIGAREG